VRSFLIKEAGDLEATLPFVLRSYFSLAGNVLFNALIHANQKVRLLNQGKGVHERGGASVLAGYLDGDLLALANVGGCSAWLIRGGVAAELVTPRTYGRLCDPFASDPPLDMRVPLMSLGMAEDLEPEIFEYRVQEGDRLLLHTDGVSSSVREQIAAIPGSDAVMSFLGQCTFKDNASIILVVL
jgi:serine/threonine protein phosphatase PrpC